MAYNTNNPLGSSDPRDLFDNSTNFDQGMNSNADTFKGRFGQNLYTWAFFNRLAASGQSQINVIVGTVNTAATAAIQQMEQTAAELGDDLNNKRFDSYAAMNANPQTREAVVAVVDGDPDMNLNGWYAWDNTDKEWVRFQDQPAMLSILNDRTKAVPGVNIQTIPIVVTNSGQVVVWLENGQINGAGLDATVLKAAQKLVKSQALVSNSNIPLILSESGQVVAWLKDGSFDAAGLNTRISAAIQAALSGYQKFTQPKLTDSSKLYAYRAKLASAIGGSGFARVIYTGDSWSQHLNEIAQPLANALYRYGQSGDGWISVYADEGGASSTLSQLLNGARLVKSSGWTLSDMSSSESNSLDGHAVTATGNTAKIDITNLKTQSLTWYYKDTGGVFRYSVDGGSPVTVTGSNTGARKSIEISGLADESHSITFDLVGNAGTVVMYGGMAGRSAVGVEVSKAGNGGSTSVQWAGIAPFVQAYASELKPDLAIIVLGTNDLNQGITKATFKSNLQVMVNAYRAGSPDCAVLLMTPTRGQDATDLGLIGSYADAMYEISQATEGVEFLNLNGFMPPRAVTNALGLWRDALHLSEAGGRFVTGLLMKYFLKTN